MNCACAQQTNFFDGEKCLRCRERDRLQAEVDALRKRVTTLEQVARDYLNTLGTRNLEDIERRVVCMVVTAAESKSQAALDLGIARSTLFAKLAKYKKEHKIDFLGGRNAGSPEAPTPES